MTLGTIARFQFGNAAAIRAVAENRNALWVGVVLVLLTAIARNYDQLYFSDTPRWLFGPLLFSIVSGSLLFLVVYSCFVRRHIGNRKEVRTLAQWRSFMTLFWMTAPVAWIYAIPTERLFDSYRATQGNLALLAIVSLWRVLLMSRIVSVVNGIRFWKTFEWVLLGATIEVILVVFVGGIFSPAFSRAIIRGMGGMRNAPEENLLLNTLFAVGTGAVVLLGLVAITAIFRSSGDFRAQAFPKAVRGKIPWAGVAALTAGWVAIAIPAQLEQRRFNEHSGLVLNGSHRESLDYLRTKSKSDFPPARRLEPNPYEYRLWEHLPGVLATLRADDPAWVKEHYFGYMEIVFDHDMLRGNLKEWANAFETMGNLPEGERWISRHRKELKEWYDNQVGTYNDDREAAEFLQLYNVLNELGVLTRTGAPESGAAPPSPTN